jgi:hypothetical protein
MITLALAYLLNSPTTATAAWTATVALTEVQAASEERAHRTAELGAWLDSIDAAREMAMGRKVSPFEGDAKISPFEDDTGDDPLASPPRLFWWATNSVQP